MITRSKPTDHNTGEASASPRAEIPDGIHIAKILTADETQTATGIPYIELKLEIAGHENDKRIYTKIWLSEGNGNHDRNYDALLSCGYAPDSSGALPDPAAELFAHRTCKVRIGTNKRGYKDVTYWIIPTGRGKGGCATPKLEKAIPTPVVPTPQNITHDVRSGDATGAHAPKPAFTRNATGGHAQTAPRQNAEDDDIPF